MYPTVRLRCCHLPAALATTALGNVYFQLACDDIRSGSLGYDRDALAYALALFIRTTRGAPMYPLDRAEWLSMLQAAAAYLLPEDLPLRAPLELNKLIETASAWLGLMPSANPSPETKALGVHYYRAAFLEYVKLWSEYGNVIFSGVDIAGYDGAEADLRTRHKKKRWASPASGAARNSDSGLRNGKHGGSSGNGKITLIVSASGCMMYDVASMHTEGAVAYFYWNEVLRVNIAGAARSNVDIDLGDVHGRLVIRCFSAEQAAEVVTSMQDHTHALLRRGRGADESASVSSWWLKFRFGELPPAPAPLSLQQAAHQEPDAALDGLIAIVLGEARARNLVCAQVVSDLESICSRIAGNVFATPAVPKVVVHGVEIVGSGRTQALKKKMYMGEFAKVLKYLNVLPEDVTERRVAEVLDPKTTVGVDYAVFCRRFRALMDM
jgi:hypothetical protein